MLCEEAIAYSTLPKCIREAQTSPDDATPSSDAISSHIDDSDNVIPWAVEEIAFSSVRQLSRATYLSKITEYRRFSEKFGFTARHLRAMSHILSDDQKVTQIQCSKSLLT
jgi:hypothetical protein